MIPALEPSAIDSDQQVLPWSEAPYVATWDEVEKAFGWSSHRRARLLAARARLEELEAQRFPILAAWLNGSFVTGREMPNDIDVAVLLDGAAFKDLHEAFGGPAAFSKHLSMIENQRYELGGTASQHLTDFRHLVVYGPGTGLHALSSEELDYWAETWSRLEVTSPNGGSGSTLVADAKGYVEVRWS